MKKKYLIKNQRKTKKTLVSIFLLTILLTACSKKSENEKFYAAALNYYEKKEFTRALQIIQKVKKTNSDFSRAQFLKAKILFFKKDFLSSYQICQRLVKNNSSYTDAKIFLIRNCICLEKNSDAERLLQKEIDFNSSDWRIYYLYSLLYKKQNILEKEIEMLNKAENCLQESQSLYENLSYVWEELDSIERAIDYQVKKNILKKKDN